ncbi:MAG: DUF4160 domain-containing protein [Bacteroidota bacterium]
MSPTVLRIKGYRFFFFSREETRKHIHVYCEKGEAKIWLEPEIKIARNFKLQERELNEILLIAKENKDEFIKSWERHFESGSN